MPTRYCVYDGAEFHTFSRLYLAIIFAEPRGLVVQTVAGKRIAWKPPQASTPLDHPDSKKQNFFPAPQKINQRRKHRRKSFSPLDLDFR